MIIWAFETASEKQKKQGIYVANNLRKTEKEESERDEYFKMNSLHILTATYINFLFQMKLATAMAHNTFLSNALTATRSYMPVIVDNKKWRWPIIWMYQIININLRLSLSGWFILRTTGDRRRQKQCNAWMNCNSSKISECGTHNCNVGSRHSTDTETELQKACIVTYTLHTLYLYTTSVSIWTHFECTSHRIWSTKR